MPSTVTDLTKVLSYFQGREGLEGELRKIIRQAIDMVIDGLHTGRYSIEELDKTEKTYIGTKVEHLIIYGLDLKKHQRLDTRIEGIPVDIKCTVRSTWSIPKEAIDEICLLVKINEKRHRFWVGLVLVRHDSLNPGRNRDGKGTLNKNGRNSIVWLVDGAEFPKCLLQTLPDSVRRAILDPGKSATERMAELFRRCIGRVVNETTIDTVGRQRDSSKRIRKNGGAREILEAEGIVVLSNRREHNDVLEALGLPQLGVGEFMSLRRTPDGSLQV